MVVLRRRKVRLRVKTCGCAASPSLCLSVWLCVVCLSLVLSGVNESFFGGIGWFYYVGLHSSFIRRYLEQVWVCGCKPKKRF